MIRTPGLLPQLVYDCCLICTWLLLFSLCLPQQVAAEAARVLGSAGPVPSAQLVEEFNEALCAIAFDRANIPAGRKVVRARLHNMC